LTNRCWEEIIIFSRRFKISLTFIVIATLLAGTIVFASNHDKLKNVQNKLNKTRKELKEGKQKEKSLTNQIIKIQEDINETENSIKKLEGNIQDTKIKVVEVQGKLARAEQMVSEQSKALNARLRSMYLNDSGISVLEVIFGSESITDFMSNMDMVEKIYDNDTKMLNRLKDNKDLIGKEKQRLASLENTLEKQQTQHENKKNNLANSQHNIAVLKNQVALDNKKLAEEIDALNQEANRITSEIRRLQSKGTQYTGGVFIWLVTGKITSPFGYRIHPVLKERKLHTGIDIAASSGTPVKAANAGTVIKAGAAGSYGNMVMIDHGGGIVTLYAHNSRIAVSTGTQVQKGQVISYVGSTGRATGPHLHFEVRVNGDYKNPMGWL